jgi:hypothetical protein
MNKALVSALLALVAAIDSLAAGVELSSQSRCAGDLKLSCREPGGWSFSFDCREAGGCEIATVKMESTREEKPPKFEIGFDLSGAGVKHVWSYDWMRDA